MLEIWIRLPLDNSLGNNDAFRDDLDSALKEKDFGYCGSNDTIKTGSSGEYQFDVYLSNFHDGLNLLRGKCLEMEPIPKIPASIVGKENDPIQIFPTNYLTQYLEGLDKGGK